MNKLLQFLLIFIIINKINSFNSTYMSLNSTYISNYKIFNKLNNTKENSNNIFYYLASLIVM
jgi:hypothetical protein